MKTFTKVWGNAAWLPAKTKSDVFVRTTTHFQTDSCGDSIRMSDDASDMQSAVVGGFRVAANAGGPHDVTNVVILDASDRAGFGTRLAYGLVRWDMEHPSSTNNVDGGENRAQEERLSVLVTTNRKIVAALVETETNVDFEDDVARVRGHALVVRYKILVFIVESKICSNER